MDALQPKGIQVLLRHDDLLIATWRSVVVARWLGLPTVALMDDVVRSLRGSAQRGEFAAINFIEVKTATSLPEEVRSRVAEVQRQFDGRQRALATVMEGGGFMASLVRSIAVGLALTARTKFPQRVFDSPDAAADWVAPLLADLGPAAVPELRAVLSAIRTM